MVLLRKYLVVICRREPISTYGATSRKVLSFCVMSTQNWADGQTERIAQEVRRLRKSQRMSAQRLADRTAELGHGITRTVLADLESGRRRHLTVAELTVLARALSTAPTALMYPAPYDETVEVVPGVEAMGIWAAQWFSGLLSGWTESAVADDRAEYDRNLKRSRIARKVWEIEAQKVARRDQLRPLMRGGKDNLAQASELADALADLQREIDELQADDAW